MSDFREGLNTRPNEYLWKFLTERIHCNAALQHVKPGKASGPDSIFPELIIYAGAALKSWFRDFLSFCLRRLKIPKIYRREFVVTIPKTDNPSRTLKELSTNMYALYPHKQTYLHPCQANY